MSSWFSDVAKFSREASLLPDRHRDAALALERAVDRDAYDFSVATYNVNAFLAASAPADRVRDALERCPADVVCLQETTHFWADHLVSPALRERYPHSRFHHVRSGCGGSAVLSAHPIVSFDVLAPPVDGSWFPATVARVLIPHGRSASSSEQPPSVEVQFVVCHLRPPVTAGGAADLSTARLTNPIRLEEIRWLLSQLGGEPATPTIFLGDFNEGDEAPALGHLAGAGFTDALAQHVPAERETHRWPLGVLTLKKRLDHIVYSPQLSAAYCYVMCGYEEGASDHQPVVAFLRFNEQSI